MNVPPPRCRWRVVTAVSDPSRDLHADCSDVETEWSVALDAMERHIERITSALAGAEQFPGDYATEIPDVPLPAKLAPRARLIAERQRDIEFELRRRTCMVGAFIFSGRRIELETGVSVDVRS